MMADLRERQNGVLYPSWMSDPVKLARWRMKNLQVRESTAIVFGQVEYRVTRTNTYELTLWHGDKEVITARGGGRHRSLAVSADEIIDWLEAQENQGDIMNDRFEGLSANMLTVLKTLAKEPDALKFVDGRVIAALMRRELIAYDGAVYAIQADVLDSVQAALHRAEQPVTPRRVRRTKEEIQETEVPEVDSEALDEIRTAVAEAAEPFNESPQTIRLEVEFDSPVTHESVMDAAETITEFGAALGENMKAMILSSGEPDQLVRIELAEGFQIADLVRRRGDGELSYGSVKFISMLKKRSHGGCIQM